MTHGIPPAPLKPSTLYDRPPKKHTIYTNIDLEVVTTDVDEVEFRLHKVLNFIRELGFKVHGVNTRDFD